MNEGDWVTGIPTLEAVRKKHPTVTGRYSSVSWESLGEKYLTEFVVADGQSIDCLEIRPAGRREKETVF